MTPVSCGDGSVPKGVWPNCDPCAGGGASAGVAEKVNRLREKMDQAVQPQSFDFVKDCLAGIENLFYGNMDGGRKRGLQVANVQWSDQAGCEICLNVQATGSFCQRGFF